jgi:protein phosphatase
VTRFDQIEHACLTDVGVRRSHNQDNLAIQLASDEEQWRQRGHLFLVADGMGAHAVGEKASEQAAAVIPHTYHKHAQQGAPVALRRAFVEANASIHTCGQQNREFQGMGTTATALLLRPEGAWVSHVGDSRVYRIRDNAIEQLSYDHSLVWEYARLQRVDPDEVKDIPSNVIHRCLGPEALVQVDIEGPHDVEAGDIFLLCSDGLSGLLTDAEMGAFATALPPAEACRFMVDLAKLRGGPDNITVLIVRISGKPGMNGVVLHRLPAPARDGILPPWWVASLLLGPFLVITAIYLVVSEHRGAVPVFLLAAVSIIAGLVGLFVHYYREKSQVSEMINYPEPKIYRHATFQVDRPLLDKLDQAVIDLRRRAEERSWKIDEPRYEQHHAASHGRLEKADLVGAFRENCRALLVISGAKSQWNSGDEGGPPVWEKPH